MTNKKETPALDEVMDYIERIDELDADFEVPADTYAQALSEGLPGKFSFFVRFTPADQNPNGDEDEVYAAIYPNGMDSTWEGSQFVAPMMPEARIEHECSETRWTFESRGYDAGEIAKLMVARGLNFDADAQKQFSPEAYETVQSALDEQSKKTTAQQIFELIKMQVMDVPDALYEKALTEDFAREFEYHLASMDGYEDDEKLIVAFIYPKGEDNSWHGAALLRPLLPEAESVDECLGIEWHFEDYGLTTAGEIAGLLASRGFTLNEEQQEMCDPDLMPEIKEAIAEEEKAAPAAKPNAPKM